MPATSHSILDRPYAAAALPLAGIAVAVVLWLWLPPDGVQLLMDEGGPFQRPTELLYFAVAIAIALLLWGRIGPAVWVALCVTFVAFGAREMDLHKHFTGASVLKLSFYSSAAPMQQRLVAAAFVIPILFAVGFLVFRFARSWWRALRRREPLATTVACFILTMIVSKMFDRSVSILEDDYGIVASASAHALVSALEEIMELSLPLIAAWGVLQSRRLVSARLSRS